MKIIELILFNTKKMYCESKSMFFYILLGVIFAVFGIFFYSGYFINSFYNTNFTNELYISIENINIGEIQDLMNSIVGEVGFENVVVYNDPDYEDNISIVGMYDNKFESHMLCGESYSLDTDIPCAVLSEYSMDRLDIHKNITDEKIEKNGDVFEIIGISKTAFGFCVPIKYYINHYPFKYINVKFNNRISDNLMNSLIRYNYNYELIKNESPFESIEFMTSLFIAIAIFCLSFINIIMFFSLWNIKMKPSFRVYYIYGCNKITKFLIVSGEFFLVSIIGTLISFGLFMSVYKLFGKLTIVYAENIVNYLYVLLLIIFILLIFSLYFGWKNAIKQRQFFRMKE